MSLVMVTRVVTCLSSGAVTGLVDRLRKAGFVDRRTDPEDRRRVLVTLLPNTRLDALRPAVFGPLGLDMAEITSRYSPEELEAISDFLQRTTGTLVRHTARVSRINPESL